MSSKRFFCIDAHTCGNPVRLVVRGGPVLGGASMSEKRALFLKEYDWIRKGLMFEPRGHDMMSGSILYPPSDPKNDIGVLFIETSGCLPMCGHGMIGTVTIAVQEGLLLPKTPAKLRMETPAGLVKVDFRSEKQKVTSVKLTNVPAYLAASDLEVDCPDLGPITVDIAYGGNFYAIVDKQENYNDLADHSVEDLIRWSRVIRSGINDRYTFVHPEDSTIKGCSHILWTGRPHSNSADARNAVFYGEKAIDRSPCGTGTSARMAQWNAKGKLEVGQDFVHESIIGSCFVGRAEATTKVGNKPAIVPSIEGSAYVTGYNTIFLDDEDPYVHGFQVL